MQTKKLETSVMRNRIYEHYRGNRYVVIDIAKDADKDGDQFCVVYRALYDHGQLYVTTLERFTGVNNEGSPRFRLLEIVETLKVSGTFIPPITTALSYRSFQSQFGNRF